MEQRLVTGIGYVDHVREWYEQVLESQIEVCLGEIQRQIAVAEFAQTESSEPLRTLVGSRELVIYDDPPAENVLLALNGVPAWVDAALAQLQNPSPPPALSRGKRRELERQQRNDTARRNKQLRKAGQAQKQA